MLNSRIATAVGIFLLAFCVRAVELTRLSQINLVFGHLNDGNLVSYDEGINVAHSLVEYGEFANPFFNDPTGSTAHVAPSFPAQTALIFTTLGSGLAGGIARDLVNIAGFSLLFALLPAISGWLGMGSTPGVVAGITAAGYPLFGLAELSQGRDEWLAALGLLLLTVYAWRIAGRDELAVRPALIYGAGWGALMYVLPSLALIFPAHLLVILFARSRSPRKRLEFAALVGLTFLAAITPWTIRNRVVMGGWIFMRDNAGLELEVSNGDGAKANFDGQSSDSWFCSVHPNCNPAAAEQIRQVGEVEFNRLAMEKAVSWIEANPARFAALTFRRAIYFWCDMRADGDKFFIRAAISLLGLTGLWLMWTRGLTLQAALLGIVWIAYPTTFYMIQYMERYVAPIGPVILLPAAFAVCALAVPKTKLVEAGGVEPPSEKARNEENYVRSLLLNFIHRLRNRQDSDRLVRLISGLGSGPKPAPYPTE